MADEEKGTKKRTRRRLITRKRLLFVFLLLLVAFLVGQGPLLSWGLRKGIAAGTPAIGWELVSGEVDANLFAPWVVRDLRLRSDGTYQSETDFLIEELRISFEPVWEWFQADGRVIDSIFIEGLDGLFDFRPGAMPVKEPKVSSEEEQKRAAEIALRVMPRSLELDHSSVVILAEKQSYRLDGVNALLSETSTGALTVEEVVIEAEPVFKVLENLEAVTAWKNGVAYLYDSKLGEGVMISRFAANFVNPGGIALELGLDGFGGTLRGGVSFTTKENSEGKPEVFIDTALSAFSLNLEEAIRFATLDFPVSGQVEELRVVFRAFPSDPLRGQASLRLKTGAMKIRENGWDSLEAGAEVVNSRAQLRELKLRQGDNAIDANGEVVIPKELEDLPDTRFLANISAKIPDAETFLSLFGPELEGIRGKLYVHGSVTGREGNYEGYLNGEMVDFNVRGAPLASGRLNLQFKNRDVEILNVDFVNGDDSILAKGHVRVEEPYRYSGEASASIVDISAYLAPFQEQLGSKLISGGVHFKWQGDGTASAHSGAFELTANEFSSDFTPDGISGDLAGTYSPGNIYLSQIKLQRYTTRIEARGGVSEKGINLNDFVFEASKQTIASGYAFAPINLFELIEGEPLVKAFIEGQEYRASIRSSELRISDVFQLAGQEPVAEGTVSASLDISGPGLEPKIDGKFDANNIEVNLPDVDIPTSDLSLTLNSGDERLAADGSFTIQGFDPFTITASVPFGFREEEGNLVFANPVDSIEAKAIFPRTSLAAFKPFVPGLRQLRGTLSGQVAVSNSLAEPKLDGEIRLQDGLVEVNTRTPALRDLKANIQLAGSNVQIEDISGTIGAGPFSIKGVADISDLSQPGLELELKGRKVLFVRSPDMRLRANLDIDVNAKGSQGAIKGSVRLLDGRIYQRLEILPLLTAGGGGDASGEINLPKLRGLVPPPAGDWTLDVEIRNETPFTVGGNIASGSIVPQVDITGTLGNIVPLGQVEIKDLQAFLPFTTMTIDQGLIYFTKDNPGMPILDIRGTAEAQRYEVFVYAYGPLSDKQLVLRSDPPLAQESIILLLTAGLTPGVDRGGQLGQAAAGQGGLLLLRTLIRQFNRDSTNTEAFLNRIHLSVVPPIDETEQNSTIRGEVDITDNWGVATERDGFGFYNVGVVYTYRFR